MGSLHPKRFPQLNNIQWLRLFFALQVALSHAHGHVDTPTFFLLGYVPGVPAFYFISGFLIYDAWLRIPDLRSYVINRFARIFPALFVVAVGGVLLVIVAHGATKAAAEWLLLLQWFSAQITLGQAYNPAEFRDIGVGVINGVLPTITVEIIFYACVPVIVIMERVSKITIPALIGVSLSIFHFGPSLLNQPIGGGKTLFNVLEITPLVWGWMFGFGMLSVKYFSRISPYLGSLAPIALVGMILMGLLGDGLLFNPISNRLGVIYFLCYSVLILFVAFKIRLPKLETDLSYGIYLWHMPLMNLMLVLAFPWTAAAVLPVTIIFALLSWRLIEKPALDWKRTRN